DLRRVPDQVAENVDGVDIRVCHHATAGQLRVAEPRLVGIGLEAGEAIPERHDVAKLAPIDHALEMLDIRLKPVTEADREQGAGALDGVGDRLRIVKRPRQWLLAEHGDARFSGRDTELAMEQRRRADTDDINLATVDEFNSVRKS